MPQAILASIALLVTAGATLALGQGIRVVIDSGFVTGSTTDMGSSLIIFVGVIAVLVVGTCVRLYTVSWIGERVSADIRLAVFEHLIHMHPGFVEPEATASLPARSSSAMAPKTRLMTIPTNRARCRIRCIAIRKARSTTSAKP